MLDIKKTLATYMTEDRKGENQKYIIINYILLPMHSFGLPN